MENSFHVCSPFWTTGSKAQAASLLHSSLGGSWFMWRWFPCTLPPVEVRETYRGLIPAGLLPNVNKSNPPGKTGAILWLARPEKATMWEPRGPALPPWPERYFRRGLDVRIFPNHRRGQSCFVYWRRRTRKRNNRKNSTPEPKEGKRKRGRKKKGKTKKSGNFVRGGGRPPGPIRMGWLTTRPSPSTSAPF